MCACMLFGKHVLLLRVTRDKEEEEDDEEEEEDTEVSPSSRASRCERAAISISKHVFSSFPRSHHCGLHQPLSHSRESVRSFFPLIDPLGRQRRERQTRGRKGLHALLLSSAQLTLARVRTVHAFIISAAAVARAGALEISSAAAARALCTFFPPRLFHLAAVRGAIICCPKIARNEERVRRSPMIGI